MGLSLSANFSGSNYLSVANYTGNPAAFSVSCWVWLGGNQTSRIFFANFLNDGSNKGWGVGISDSTANQLKLYLGSNTLLQSGTLETFTWTHAVFTWDGTTAKIYLSGNTTPNNTLTSGVNYGAVPTNNYIGSLNGSSQDFLGRLAGVGYWSKALSTAEVTSLYNNGLGLTYADVSGSLLTSLVAYYDFSTATLGTDLANAHNMANTGSVTFAAGPAARTVETYYRRPIELMLQPQWCRNLGLCIVPNDSGIVPKDLANTFVPVLAGGVSKGVGAFGPHWHWDGTGSSWIDMGRSFFIGATELTICVLARSATRHNTNANSAGIRNIFGTENDNPAFILRYFTNDYTSPNLVGFIVGGSNECFTSAPDAITEWNLYTGRFRGDGGTGNMALFYGANKVATTTNGLANIPSDGVLHNVYIGGTSGGTQVGRSWSGDIAAVYVWSRALLDTEIASLAIDPFAPVRSKSASLPVLSATTGSVMIASASLSYEAVSVSAGGGVGGGQSSLSSLGLLAGGGVLILGGNSVLSTQNQLSSLNSVSMFVSASLSVVGPISVAGVVSLGGLAEIGSLSLLDGAPTVAATGQTSLSSLAPLAALNTVSILASALLSSSAPLAGEGLLTLGGATALSSENSLVTSPSLLAGAQTSLSYLNALFAYDSTTILASASLSSLSPLVGVGVLATKGSSSLSSLAALAGASALGINGTASLVSNALLSSSLSVGAFGASALFGECFISTVDVTPTPSPADVSGPRDDRFYFINESYQIPFSHRFLDHGYTSP